MLISCTPQGAANKTKTSHPNIIYVLADDLGTGDVKAFNPESKVPTPNLDQLASDGMMFTDAHTSSAVCTPTRYGIITGRYNWRSRLKSSVLWGEDPALIPNDRLTVASLLKAAGYYTAFIGKWHLGWDWGKDEDGNIDFNQPVKNNPNDVGFDYAYGHVASLDMPPYVYVENGMVTAKPVDSTVNEGRYSWWRKGPTAPDFHHTDVTPNFFRKGMDYIKERTTTKQPFFLYLALPSPHTPILPTEEWQGKSGLNPYADFVMMVDGYMGQLLETIKEAGIEDNTLVIFTSDNGCSPAAHVEELTEKGHYPSYIYRGYKADIYEGGHRVPFIVRWPGVVKGNTQCSDVICTTDLVATCAAIVGYNLKDNEAEDSYSMLSLLKGEDLGHPLREATVHHSINGSFAIRQGDWKLAMCPGSGGWSYPVPGKDITDDMPDVQLFNLKDDPEETKNLESENPEKVKELKALLSKYIEEGRSTPGIAQRNDGEKVWKQLWWMQESSPETMNAKPEIPSPGK